MSIINFGLQGVAIMRDIMSTELEDIFKKVDALEEIHAAAAKNEDLKNGLRDCILNIQQLLHSRTERLMHVKQRQKYYQRKRISRTHYRICHYSFQIKNILFRQNDLTVILKHLRNIVLL
ncbi:uncharacterized protein OCT59_017036 [Rhizophagus irregularis]|uniref:uncharacterized protein n=1 Tax=Rhizophagus irregularis TaxID=588596 RepID=UPI00331E5BE8|nr:hypothetical protein OCT59_017036 [Rhizophagus irregularis]